MEVRLELDAAALYTAFSKAPERVRGHLRIALIQSMDDVANHAQAHHAFTSRSRRLESQGIKRNFSSETMTATVSLDTSIPYAASIHNGSRAHEIRPNASSGKQVIRFPSKNGGFMFAFGPMESKADRARALRWVAKNAPGSQAMFRWPKHPGTKPDLFLHAALAAKEGAIVTRMQGAVSAAIKEVGL